MTMTKLRDPFEPSGRRRGSAVERKVALVAVLGSLGCKPSVSAGPDPGAGEGEMQEAQPESTGPQSPRLSDLVMGGEDGCVVEDHRRLLCWGPHFVSGEPLQRASELLKARRFDLGQGDARIVDVALAHGKVWAASDDGQLRWPSHHGEGFDVERTQVQSGVEQVRVTGSAQSPVICTRAGTSLVCLDGPPIAGIVDFDVLARDNLLCALHVDGAVDCWDPRLGPRTGYGYSEPIVDGAQLEIGAGVCVRTSPGELHCNASAHVHASGFVESFARLEVDTQQFKRRFGFDRYARDEPVWEIEMGASHRCEIRDGGAVYCQGRNNFGQIGAGDSELHGDPVHVGLPGPASEIAVGETQTCALVSDAVYCWGALGLDPLSGWPPEVASHSLETRGLLVDADRSCVVLPDDRLRCWGPEIGLWEGNGDIVAASTPADAATVQSPVGDFRSSTSGASVLLSGGEASWGQVLSTRGAPRSWSVFWTRANVARIDADGDGLCLVTRRGALECWARELSTKVTRLDSVPKLSKVAAVSLEFPGDVCVVGTDGRVRCAGTDERDGRGWDEVPELTGARDIVSYRDGRCVRHDDGRVSCWTGASTTAGYALDAGPASLTLLDVAEIDGGEIGLCARTGGGAVYCGQPDTGAASLERVIDSGAVEIDVGRMHWCARIDSDADGSSERVECHGDNRRGQLGKLGAHVMLAPTAVGLPPPEPRSSRR